MSLTAIPGLIGALIGGYLGVMISGALGYWLVAPLERKAQALPAADRAAAAQRALILRRVVLVVTAIALAALGWSFGRELAGVGLSTPPAGG